jgi:hypothetical protein
MRIGVDFDNTIVCYDGAFHAAALEEGLIPPTVALNKNAVRDHLRRNGQEEDWIRLQGLVYGKRMELASPFAGAFDVLRALVASGCEVAIISHKTLHPYRGPAFDLHLAAREWLDAQGFFSQIGLSREAVFFELTKVEKIARIARQRCTHFIDDLPEILADQQFPAETKPLLFDPAGTFPDTSFPVVSDWTQLDRILTTGAKARS